MPLPLLALAIAAFGIGTTEFVIMGLLPNVARDLAVSIPAAGMLVSGYALGVTIGAPILAIVTAKMPRKQALMSLIGVFIVGNLLCAIAPGYWVLMGARIVTAFCHGAFFGIGSVVAADLVAPNRRAQAIALMFTGLTLANVLGVPLGTALGQAAGWRATFWVVTLIGLLAAAALQVCLPKHIEMRETSILREFDVLKNPQVLMVLGISVLASASLFSVFTYITPILEDVTGFSPHAVTLVLLLFGLGLTVGSTLGGKLADWKVLRSLLSFLLAIVVILTVFAATMHSADSRDGHDLPVGRARVRDRAAAADPDRESRERRAEPRLDAQPGRVQPRQRDGRMARRHGDRCGRAAGIAAVGRRDDGVRRVWIDVALGIARTTRAALGNRAGCVGERWRLGLECLRRLMRSGFCGTCVRVGLLALPLCGAAVTFFAAAKKVTKESSLPTPMLAMRR